MRDWGYDGNQSLYQGVGAVERKAIDSQVLIHTSHRFYGGSPKGVHQFRLFVKMERLGGRKRVYQMRENIELELDGRVSSWLEPAHVLGPSRRMETIPNIV